MRLLSTVAIVRVDLITCIWTGASLSMPDPSTFVIHGTKKESWTIAYLGADK